MWTLLLARSSSLGHPIGAPRVFFLTRNTCSMNVSNQMKSWCTSMNTWTHTCTYIHILAEQRERSEANDRSLFEIPRYLHIYVCLHVNCARPCTPYTSPITLTYCALSYGTLAAVRSTTLRSCLYNRYGRRRHFS